MDTMQKVYLDAQAACGLKEGDWVKVVRQAETGEAGWRNDWSSKMYKTVGQFGRVAEICVDGVEVAFGKPIYSTWKFPYFILEKVEEPDCEFKPFEKVLVRGGDNSEWQPRFFAKYDSSSKEAPYMTISTTYWGQCIPYEGNEHLLGTTEKSEG